MHMHPRDVDVVAPNLHHRYSGVTSTVIALVPFQARSCRIAACGFGLPAGVPRVGLLGMILHGWGRPRVWHARRNDEMIVGLLLRSVLRQPWKLVFTSAAQRRHTRFTRFLIRQMDAVVCPSPMSATYLERPAQVIQHGIDISRFQPAADRTKAWRSMGLPGLRGIGVFGRVRAQKGTDLFVRAMIELLPHYPDWTAVVTGLEAPEERGFVADLDEKIRKAGMENRIFRLGLRPHAELPRWFQSVSLYVAPMRREGFGLTTLEAMASRTAVVATRTGASPLIVVPGETGQLVDPDDLRGLVDAIRPYLANPELCESHGQAGLEKVRRDHDIRLEAEGLVAVYRRLLGSLRPPSAPDRDS